MIKSISKHIINTIGNCMIRQTHNIRLLITFYFILSGAYLPVLAQSLTGTTGYYNIPSGEINEDKTIFAGTNLLSKEYKKWGSPDHDAMNFFVTNSFMPFFEISIRFTRMIGLDDYSSTVGDRMASIRFRALGEEKYLPGVVIGFQNFFTTLNTGSASHFNSTYIVATKNITLPHVIQNIGITAGYGSELFTAADYQFIGFFGGIKITPKKLDFLELIAEYDAEKWNAGARVTILKHLVLLAGFEGFNAFSGGLSYRFMLP
ncbi:MAG TPA: YjbH domain-containing protein [Bacteroidales bacterium]|nr:YjbH domain-containing protein [Bacteroidales bacterium]